MENSNETESLPLAVIFDLDGVITQTRKIHYKAWKLLFNWFFKQTNRVDEPELSDHDYEEYVDGKPRYEGVKSFLESREISLPMGQPIDDPGYETICSVGNKKNIIFNDIIDQDGVEVYQDAVKKLKKWKQEGKKTAIVSSSKNCQHIIENVGIENLFDVRVDGNVASELNLKGKPYPDIFSKTMEFLGIQPHEAVVFEDANSGVKSAQRSFAGLVVGINRKNQKEDLLKNGADLVFDSFDQIDINDPAIKEEYFSVQGEPILPYNKEFFEKIQTHKPAIFLDYDGTLTPIVAKPDQAILSPEMKKTLQQLADVFTVAIVTGRDKDNVEELVGLEQLIYAGSHGYIITGPNGLHMEHPESDTIIPELDKIEQDARKLLQDRTQGTQIDRKKYAIGLHFRNARPEDEDQVQKIASHLLEKYPGHKTGTGKKIIEIKPDLDWHKGKAINYIMDALGLSDEGIIPLFIGDDITDEDGFKEIKDNGIGILVGGHGEKTYAPWSLKNVYQVRIFFEKLIDIYKK